MRNLLLILLLANILYLVYGLVTEDDERRGEILVEESQLGPKLELAEQAPTENGEGGNEAEAEGGDIETLPADDSLTVADNDDEVEDEPQDGDVPDESLANVVEDEPSETSGLTAVIGRSCVTLGPFRERDDADRAQVQYARDGMNAVTRSTIGTRQVGNWVMVRDIASYDEAQSMLAKLKEGGLADAYIAESDDDGIKIYLGLFSQAAGAERIELQATSLGVPAEIVPEVREGSVYFVDVALPPGRGAGEMIDKYGEDSVMLRDQATCPGSNG